jgi:hypothetical protein
MNISNESVPVPMSPEEPPLAPYDPPDPAPQAIAWLRAIKVIMRQVVRQNVNLATAREGASRRRASPLRDRRQARRAVSPRL